MAVAVETTAPCAQCSLDLPTVLTQLDSSYFVPFDNDNVIGYDVDGCAVRNLTCTSNRPNKIRPMIEFNNGTLGTLPGNLTTVTIQLVCNESGSWKMTLFGFTNQIDILSCFGDFSSIFP
ncbi:unnamed protein product, partial [Mesorhabditis belari]|uniref:C6 domain-containing protein n=1 Tax=Mesorhabditis belari TaxID=2138241 RepID=A0AAF3JB54_9BILA